MKTPLLALSHVALGVAGWWLSSALGPTGPSEASERATKIDRPPAFHREADELVRRIRSDLAKHAAAEAKRVPPEVILREKFLARLSELALPTDPAAAFREALAEAHDEEAKITAGASFVLWAQADPEAALSFIAQDESDALKGDLGHIACELAGKRLPPETLLPLLESLDYRRDDFLRGMARAQLARRTVSELAELVNGSSAELRSNVAFHLKDQWPAGRLNDFGAFVTTLDDPAMLDYGPDQWSDDEFSAWLVRFVNRHSDSHFARRLKNGSGYARAVAGNTSLSLETRVAALYQSTNLRFHGMSPVAARQDILSFLARDEMSDFLRPDDGPDLLHAFHHGRMEAPELLGRLNARFPAYAEAGVLRDHLHHELCADDPIRASALLNSLPEGERASIMAANFERAFYQTPLDSIREALGLLPPPADEESASARSELLASIVDHGLIDYGPDYLDWIATLPEPADREEALAAIARRIEGSMVSKAREIRRIVGDTPLPPTD